MSEEKEVDALPPGVGPSDRELFDELVADTSAISTFRRSLEDLKGHCDPDDIEYAREGAENLQGLVGVLGADDPKADLNERERETLRRAQALASHSTEELFSLLADVESPVGKGDALYVFAALIEAAFYIGRCGTAAKEAAVEQEINKTTRGPVEKTRCEIALRELFKEHPRRRGLSLEQIRSQVATKATGAFSDSTLSRALRDAWKTDGE